MATIERARPGAMTLAMQAAHAAHGPKVLRIGVTEGGRVVDERVVRDRRAVTIGATERCTIALAAEGLPAQFELFARVGDGYRLNFTDAMDGRVALAAGVRSLAELRAQGLATRTSAGWQLALDESARGRITLGAVTVLFQFVVAPPAAARPQLPVAIRARPLRGLDLTWNASVAFFALVAFGGAAYAEYGYDPIVEENFAELSAPIVREVIPPTMPAAPETPEAAAVPDAPGQPTASNSAPSATRPTHAMPSRPSRPDTINNAISAAERASDVAVRELARAQFSALTGTLANGHSAVDTLHRGGLMDGSAEALAHTNGIAPATGANALRPQTGNAIVASNSLRSNALIARDGVLPSSGRVDEASDAPIGRLHLAEVPQVDGDGELAGEDIGATIRHGLGGIQQCYTIALRSHPALRGRLEVRFTIGASGRVVGTPSADGLAEAPEVGRCIENRIRYLVFGQPRGGSVSTSAPFVFVPGA